MRGAGKVSDMGSPLTPTGSVRVVVGNNTVMPIAQKRVSKKFFGKKFCQRGDAIGNLLKMLGWKRAVTV